MSERKVLTKYYPPDFDPSKITRTKKVPGEVGPKTQTVRLMAPFSMKCTACGEYIYKGRKFNARKETTDEKYYAITIYRFYIRCTRCKAEISFKTDPKGMDYECERGAKRNFEPWRANGESAKVESEEERLDRLEAEEAEQGSAMEQLEAKQVDAKREMDIADALDEIRTKNARIQRAEGKDEADKALEIAEQQRRRVEEERQRIEEEDAAEARRAFARSTDANEATAKEGSEAFAQNSTNKSDESKAPKAGDMAPPSFKRTVKKKKDFGAALGIKRKSLV
ncbi:uncharacterized protein KY384_005355 [Bacidia gigantensis]|uniref:uncharacterized protein n=1 Tax=Bacidia gigantensis TaxID=2732470 RepID=UPI001D05502A|nr:uncharacterized protein KY384_005355 [Bacidia gigantensis]KAG8529874.1 hypothetical protein KY384_005355 [Bacidia gigantensis]